MQLDTGISLVYGVPPIIHNRQTYKMQVSNCAIC